MSKTHSLRGENIFGLVLENERNPKGSIINVLESLGVWKLRKMAMKNKIRFLRLKMNRMGTTEEVLIACDEISSMGVIDDIDTSPPYDVVAKFFYVYPKNIVGRYDERN